MLRAAQIATGLVGLFMLYLTFTYLFAPESVGALLQSPPETTFAMSNLRAQGAVTVMLGILLIIGAVKMDWKFVVPGALYFLSLIVIRILSLVMDGSDPGIFRGLGLAVVLFIKTEVALQLFRRSERQTAEG